MTATSPQALTATLAVPRGSIRAQIALRPGHPVLYQTHTLDLAQPCTFAHHPMFRLAAGGEVSTGPLKCVRTFAAPTAEGHALYHPGQVTSGDVLETSAGPRPWRQYPDQTCEDFLAIVHRPGLAWTALRRHGEGDTLLLLKRSEQLPLTCLWMSNGGRQSSPWNGCHGGVLGIEDAICAGADGFAAALSGATDLSEDHVPLALPPGRHVIPHAILRIPEALTVTDVTLDDALRVQTTEGPHTVPFAPEHFQ
ncbi:hypothetical protein JANAI61_28370 [Jannaschia sp. AI_61]|nr:hypothetical protein JANAI61_28370 [Jannaschia sp. AI_61]